MKSDSKDPRSWDRKPEENRYNRDQWQGIDSELYIRAWRHIVSMSDEICPQIRWIWSPNIMSEYARPYYPGEDYVDYVGITVNLPASTSLKYNDFGEFFLQSCKGNALGEFKKPVIISETGFHSNKEDHEDSINFILSVFKYIRHDPNLKAVVFLDTDDEIPPTNYPIKDKNNLSLDNLLATVKTVFDRHGHEFHCESSDHGRRFFYEDPRKKLAVVCCYRNSHCSAFGRPGYPDLADHAEIQDHPVPDR